MCGGFSRIAEAPVAFECRRTLTLQLNEKRELALGEVLYMHAHDGIINPQNMNLDLSRYKIIGRLFGNQYANVRECFSLTWMDHSEWMKKLKA